MNSCLWMSTVILSLYPKEARYECKSLVFLKGASKNSHFFVRARKYRPENRSLLGVNEDSRTGTDAAIAKKVHF